jgi:protein-tyrosine phosphatase
VLIEPPMIPTPGIAGLLHHVQAKGYRVTLAHPERMPELAANPELAHDLVRQGVLLQVNADSLLKGGAGSRIHKLALRLCREGVAHVLASDAHRGHDWRPIDRLVPALRALEALVGLDRARWMSSGAPAAILAGQPLPTAPDVVAPARRRLAFRRR